MTRKELLLDICAEECSETAVRCSKAIRFTLKEIQEGQSLTNAERIIQEFNDIVAVMEMMKQEGMLDRVIDTDYIQAKKLKVEEWIKYSKKRGTLQEPAIEALAKIGVDIARCMKLNWLKSKRNQ